jgi:hypothetical protein
MTLKELMSLADAYAWALHRAEVASDRDVPYASTRRYYEAQDAARIALETAIARLLDPPVNVTLSETTTGGAKAFTDEVTQTTNVDTKFDKGACDE